MIRSTLKPLNPRNPDTKYMGNEPTWETQPAEGNRSSELGRAFNWYHYFYARKDAKNMVMLYLESNDRKEDAHKIRSIPDNRVSATAGWLCRMNMMGLILTEKEINRLELMFQEMFLHSGKTQEDIIETEEDKKDNVKKPNIQDYLREKAQDCAGELEGLYDDFVYIDQCKLSNKRQAIGVLQQMNPSPQLINSVIVDPWKAHIDELKEVLEGKCPQLVEGYSHYKKTDIKNMIKFIEQIIADCASFIQLKKVNRKPRRKAPVTPDKLSRKFKHLKESTELDLKGLPATQLVNKSEAWLYDVKKRKLIHLMADEYAKTFTIKNNNVIGFSAKDTLQKTIRKPEEQLKAFLKESKPGSRKAFKDIKTTEVSWNGRGSETLVILKTW